MVLQITFKLARSSYIEVKGLFRVLPVRDAIFGRFWYCRLLKKKQEKNMERYFQIGKVRIWIFLKATFPNTLSLCNMIKFVLLKC